MLVNEYFTKSTENKMANIIRLLYKMVIGPNLEFCVQSWLPHLKKDTMEIIKVQKRASQLINKLWYLPYEERLQHLGIFSLVKKKGI